jgi:CheY-like chemotaxis protein
MDQKRILVVEDDNFLRTLYIDLLKKEGYVVEFATNGEEALTKILQDDWSLILLDIIMPKMDGIQVMKKVEEQKPGVWKEKIVFLTNLESNEAIENTKKYGQGVIIKSDLTPEQFISKVKFYLQ